MSSFQPVGSFQISLPEQVWTWTADVFAIFGLDTADTVPTTELVLQHQHPADRPAVESFLDAVTTTGRPAAVWHRVVRSDDDVLQVVTTASGVHGDDGTLRAVAGHVVDVTEPVRVATSRNVDEALEQLSQSRPVIDQAKGALMLTYSIDEQTAFALLREYSQHVNIKLRDLARALVESVQQPGGWSPGTRVLLDSLVTDLSAPASGENPGA